MDTWTSIKNGRDASTAEIAATTRASAASHGIPPGLKLPGVFNELAIHSADIAEAVGRPFDLPAADYVACLEHLKNVQPVSGCKPPTASGRPVPAPWFRARANNYCWPWLAVPPRSTA